MRDKLLKTIDIVLLARLAHVDVDRIKERAHKRCDPHLAISTDQHAKPTISNPVEIVVELAMIDAASTLSKECLDEVEKLHRAVAKTIMEIEVLTALGSQMPVPQEELDRLEEQFQQCGARLQEMEKIRELTEVRCDAILAQL